MERSILSRWVPTEGSKTAIKALSVSQDEFSVRVASTVDDRFWIRVELPPGACVVVTDAMPGSQSDETMAAGLAAALRTAGAENSTILIFRDVVPNPPEDPAQARLYLHETVVRIRCWGERILSPTTVDVSFETRDGKVDVHVSRRD